MDSSSTSTKGIAGLDFADMTPDKIRALVTNKADVNIFDERGWTPLRGMCTRKGNAEIVKFLVLEGGARVDLSKDGFMALHAAAKYGDIHIARVLIENGAPVNPKFQGFTPLSFAKFWNEGTELVEYLTEQGGIDSRPPHEQGETALEIVRKL
jgi:ankyrin repeat protein